METQSLQISIRELKAKPAYAIARARAGTTVQITSHRKTVAQIVAADPSPDLVPKHVTKRRSAQNSGASNLGQTTRELIERLGAAGVQVTEATNSLKLGKPILFAPLPKGKTMSDLVLDMRGPR